MEQSQHFTSIIPCQVSNSTDNSPFSCTLVLDFTKTNAQFYLYKDNSQDTEPIRFEYSKYDKLLISTSRCIFINSNDNISTTFFFFCSVTDGFTNNNLRRFIFALADAGMLVPENQDEPISDIQNIPFRFIPEFSFIPDGFYNFTNHLIHRNVRKICMNRILSIQKKKDIPLNPRYFSFIFSYLHHTENQNINLSKEEGKNKYSLNYVFAHHLKIINKIISKNCDFKMYKKYKHEMVKAEKNSKYSIYFQMIETDYQEFNSNITNIYNRNPGIVISQIHKEKWNKRISKLCMNVCKVYIVSQDAIYYENNFTIAMKIALLLKNGIKFDSLAELSSKGNIRKEIESFSKGIDSIISEKTNEEFEAIIYSIYSALMSGLTPKLLSNFGYDFCMKALNYFAPTSRAFFILKNIDSFRWLDKDVKEIFLYVFKSSWIFWFFILRTKNSEKAIESIIASIVYHLVPKLVDRNVENESSIKGCWPAFVQELQDNVDMAKNVLDIASFFYSYHVIISRSD